MQDFAIAITEPQLRGRVEIHAWSIFTMMEELNGVKNGEVIGVSKKEFYKATIIVGIGKGNVYNGGVKFWKKWRDEGNIVVTEQ